MAKVKKTPDALIIVAVILILVALCSYIIPAGSFDRVDLNGRQVVVPGTYHELEKEPATFRQLISAPLKGFEAAGDVIAFVLLAGGAFGMLLATGAITAGLRKLLAWSSKKKGSQGAIIALLMVVFSLAGYSFGMSEESLVFVMITIPLARTMGYDSIVGVAIPFIGAGAGFAGAAINPFTVAIAQRIAEVEELSGFQYRNIVWFAFTLAAILFVLWYANRIKKNPELSLVKHIKFDDVKAEEEEVSYTSRDSLIIILFLGCLVAIIFGALKLDWYIGEISGAFLVLGIGACLIKRMKIDASMKAFMDGAKDMLHVGLIIGLAKSILVVMDDANITDTMLFVMSGTIQDLPKSVSIQVMFFVQGAINFFIPSGSGQAAITMPIMAPLADLLGITRQTAVLAYQFGDGLFNLIIPTSGVTMGVLSMGKIPFNVWLKWIWKLMVVLVILAMIFLYLPVSVFEYH